MAIEPAYGPVHRSFPASGLYVDSVEGGVEVAGPSGYRLVGWEAVQTVFVDTAVYLALVARERVLVLAARSAEVLDDRQLPTIPELHEAGIESRDVRWIEPHGPVIVTDSSVALLGSDGKVRWVVGFPTGLWWPESATDTHILVQSPAGDRVSIDARDGALRQLGD